MPIRLLHIRLLIVDDHELVREGLRMAFADSDIQIVAEAADGQTAFEELSRQPIDVALVDVRMPGADGFRFLELVHQAGLKLPVVVMHTMNDGTENARRSQALGARGMLSKGLHRDELLNAVRRVHAGETLWSVMSDETAD